MLQISPKVTLICQKWFQGDPKWPHSGPKVIRYFYKIIKIYLGKCLFSKTDLRKPKDAPHWFQSNPKWPTATLWYPKCLQSGPKVAELTHLELFCEFLVSSLTSKILCKSAFPAYGPVWAGHEAQLYALQVPLGVYMPKAIPKRPQNGSEVTLICQMGPQSDPDAL